MGGNGNTHSAITSAQSGGLSRRTSCSLRLLQGYSLHSFSHGIKVVRPCASLYTLISITVTLWNRWHVTGLPSSIFLPAFSLIVIRIFHRYRVYNFSNSSNMLENRRIVQKFVGCFKYFLNSFKENIQCNGRLRIFKPYTLKYFILRERIFKFYVIKKIEMKLFIIQLIEFTSKLYARYHILHNVSSNFSN